MQTPEGPETYFHEKTDTFDLAVTMNENKVILTLKDFVDWVIYSNEYGDDYVGDEIHKKMNIFDIYTAFSQTKGQENTTEKEAEMNLLKHYEFGTIVEYEGSSCYKI